MTSESDCRLQTVDFFRLTIAATRTVNDWNAFTRNPLSSPFSFTDLPHPPPPIAYYHAHFIRYVPDSLCLLPQCPPVFPCFLAFRFVFDFAG